MSKINYTVEDLLHFYNTNKFPENTQFEAMLTEGMNGKPYETFHKTNSIEETQKILFDWLNKNYKWKSYSRFIFLEPNAIVIDFGSYAQFGLIKITYPTN